MNGPDLPRATRRCWGCGVGSGPCICTRGHAAWEQEQALREEEEREWLDYIDSPCPPETAAA